MTFLLIALVFLIFFSGLLSGSETALFSLSQMTLRAYKASPDPKLRRSAVLMERPGDVLVTILMLNILANLLVQNTVSSLIQADDWSLKVGVPLALTLIFGDIFPKLLAFPNNTWLAPRVAPFIELSLKLLKPIRGPLTKITSWISRFFFFYLKKENEFSSDELRHVLLDSQKKGILHSDECGLIQGALDLQESIVKERMRPREEILYYDIQDPLTRLKELFIDMEVARIPVCDGDLEKLLGILPSSQFFFRHEEIRKGSDVCQFLLKPYYVPETTNAWDLLKNLRERQTDLAMVVDEYGSISGLVTQEDLIEAVVGEIKDRREEVHYSRPSEDVMICSGKLELAEFEEIFGTPLTRESNVVTIGGWLIEQLGDIPQTGTKYAADQFLFYVLESEPRRILRLYVRRIRNG